MCQELRQHQGLPGEGGEGDQGPGCQGGHCEGGPGLPRLQGHRQGQQWLRGQGRVPPVHQVLQTPPSSLPSLGTLYFQQPPRRQAGEAAEED